MWKLVKAIVPVKYQIILGLILTVLVVAFLALIKGAPTAVVALFLLPVVFAVWGMWIVAAILEEY